MDEAVRIGKGGALTLPARLRQKHGIADGDTFGLLDLDGIFVLTPMLPTVATLAHEIERMRLEAGLSVQDLLETSGSSGPATMRVELSETAPAKSLTFVGADLVFRAV